MNPKYTITWKETVLEGSPAEGGGKNPEWGEQHILDIGPDYSTAGVITIVFLDGNDMIVQCELDAVKLCKKGETAKWHECQFEGENQGKCRIETKYKAPEYAQMQQPMGGYPQQQMGGYPQQQMGGYQQPMMQQPMMQQPMMGGMGMGMQQPMMGGMPGMGMPGMGMQPPMMGGMQPPMMGGMPGMGMPMMGGLPGMGMPMMGMSSFSSSTTTTTTTSSTFSSYA